MRFTLYKKALSAEVFIEFLTGLIKDAKKMVFLVLDNLRVHHSRKVRQWLDGREALIELFFLPSYSPELNPDEYLNCDLKARLSAGEPVRNTKHLKGKVISHLRSIPRQPEQIRSYFRHQKIRYAA